MRSGLIAILFSMAGCAVPGAMGDAGGARTSFAEDSLEPVYAWRVSPEGDLVVRVRSGGCTNKDSFDLEVTGGPEGGWRFDVALRRVEPDRCEAYLPDGVELVWTREELYVPASAELRLVNPVRP
ncbi:hypothetical protein DDZ18_07605 [Marinicauda salina]|uniref:Lipoprotein n=1 Tax=Marinicauda salina TaxID=2135793 RepID=A0A2U2BU33_9PROT|nr:hypothetical protein [Marinicauda salina]PWE17528.1 hypothetical protein DDZ18_07605 [Marinicauda salina]